MIKPISTTWFTMLISIVILGSNLSHGQTGPLSVPKGKDGYRIDIFHSVGMGQTGFHAIKFELSREPKRASKTDQVLTVIFERFNYYSRGDSECLFSKQVVIPAGVISVTDEINVELDLLSFQSMQDRIGFRVEKGPAGSSRNRKRLTRGVLMGVGGAGVGLTQDGMLHIVDAGNKGLAKETFFFWEGMDPSPNIDVMYSGTALAANNAFFQTGFLLGTSNVERPWGTITPDGLPKSWKGINSVRRIVIDVPTLKTLSENEGQRDVLERWVAAGGILIVVGDGDLSHAKEILPTLAATGKSIRFDENLWRRTGKKDAGGYELAATRYVGGKILAVKDLGVRQNVEMGIAINNAVLANLDLVSSRPAALGAVDQSTLSPIPGVEPPPLVLFLVFMFVFLTLIGPVLIFAIRQAGGRRQYLFFTVPVLSLVTCIAILGYAYIADYSKQYARVNSLTILNPQTGMAYNQTMLAYYCGNQPRYYSYDADALIRSELYGYADDFKVVYIDDQQRVSGSRIAPRRQHFIFAEQAVKTEQRLNIVPLKENESMVVQNRLGAKVKVAVVRFDDKFYEVRNLESGQEAMAVERDSSEIVKNLIAEIPDYKPTPSWLNSGNVSRFFYGSKVTFFQQAIKNCLEEGGTPKELGDLISVNRDFIAIVEHDPMVESVAEPFNYRLKSHIIYGKQ